MNPFKTHGAISWPELATSDPAAAIDFYKKVFGWTVDTMPMPTGEYHVCKINGAGLSGIMQKPDDSMPTAWIFYITVNDTEAILKKAEQLGGSIAVPVMTVPTVGTLAGIMDPTGAVIMVIQYDEAQAEEDQDVNFLSGFQTPGMFSWFELRTGDIDKASSFYSELFGWTIEKQNMPNGPYATCKIGEVGFGGMLVPPQGEVPPHWGAYVTVDDVEATNERIKEAGGTIAMEGMDIENVGRFNMFQDPTGAWLSAIKYVPMPVEES